MQTERSWPVYASTTQHDSPDRDIVDATHLESMAPAALTSWLAFHDFPDLQAQREHGETPLMHAAWHGEHSIVQALLAAGAPVDTQDDDGNTALWFACLHGGPATLLRLIDAGADLNHVNDDDISCLMQAAAMGRLDVVQLLLSHGAQADLRAPDGRSAFDMAADLGLQLLQAARAGKRRTCPDDAPWSVSWPTR